MKFNKVISFFCTFLISALLSCNQERSTESKIDVNSKKIQIYGEINNLLQIDSIFTGFEVVPLETRKECLIMEPVKLLCFKEKFYIQNYRQNLLVFDTSGNFLYQIGNRGRGPGEYLELRDFDIDQNGNIYILDFLKILRYNPDGHFLGKISFSFSPEDEILCNPIQFALKKDGNYFIWGGSLGIKENKESKLFVMYEMTNEGNLIKGYFPLKYYLQSDFGQFKHYNDLTLIDPIFGSNTIYSIDKDAIKARYFIDFGSKNLGVPVPDSFESLGSFKEGIDTKYYHSINGFIETDDWLYFRFVYKQSFLNVYYSKKTNASFISKPYPRIKGRIAPWKVISSYGDKLITLIDPKIVIEDIHQCKLAGTSLGNSEKNIIEKLDKIKITDNPILFICSMRKY